MSKTATQAIGLMQILQDFGRESSIVIQSDSSAAIAIVNREGLGRTRHIQVQYLWMQAEVAEKRLQAKKVGTDYNPADLLTKALAQEKLNTHLTALGFEVGTSRARSAPQLSR